MSEGLPKPNRIDFEPPVDLNQVAEAVALENDPSLMDEPVLSTEGQPAPPTEIQEDAQHSMSYQAVDDSTVMSPEVEARIQGLRDRGRINVLSDEGVMRPAVTATQINNSEHDPDAIAVVNKANRLTRQTEAERRRQNGYNDIGGRIGRSYKEATERKLDEIENETEDDYEAGLKDYFNDPEAWEAGLRKDWQGEGMSDDRIEDIIESSKSRNDWLLEQIGKKWDKRRGEWIKRDLEVLEAEKVRQEQYRGDLLNLYARNPEKYKAMSTEEFVAEGHKFREDGWETSRLARLESFGKSLEEKLPKLIEGASSVASVCDELNSIVRSLQRLRGGGNLDPEELFGFVEAMEGKKIPSLDTVPEDKDAPGRKEAIKAYANGQKARQDTEYKLSYGRHGYFRDTDLVPDLDRSPREQMKEAVERTKVFTNKWISDGQKAREEFDKKWGKAPEDKEPNPKAA